LIRHHAATTFSEDSSVMALVQQGLSSRAYDSGPLMIDAEKSQYSEHAVAAIQQLWRDAMGAGYE
jgi:phenylpropionate dioxygenase-like ring-hydroxylating dioxygenase large terminal subunit